MGRQFLLTNAAATGLTEAELVRQEQQHLELAGLSENNDRTSIGSARRPLSNPSDVNERGDNVDYATSRYNTDRDSGAASPNSQEVDITYADRLRNRQPGSDMTDSEKFHEMAVAT